MKASKEYVLIKKSIYRKIVLFEYDDILDITKKKDKNRMGVIKFYDNKIINKVIKKSIDNRFKKILELMASIEEADSDPSEGLVFCLDEMSKFKTELINKYNRFLKKNQIEFINKKIALIEKEIKNKIIAYRLMHLDIFEQELDEEMEEERSHRR